MKVEKLYPECKDYIWGGRRLIDKYGKKTDRIPCAESWELSFHPDGPTRLSGGELLSDCVKKEDLGKNACDFPMFPMLIKLIDAEGDLSVQVHPSDSYALENENSYGKTEMWYIVEAAEGAGIYLGFKRDVTRSEYETAIADGTLTELLNFIEVRPGQCYFIPSGTVHAIGKGCLICEIQQNSNLTYRVYDYGRVDKNGKSRELHIDKALEVSCLSRFDPVSRENGLIGASKYFTVNKLNVSGEQTLSIKDSFISVVCLSGKGRVGGKKVSVGDSVFVSAIENKVTLGGEMTVLISSVRKYYLGIDLGGTFIKGGIVDDLGNVIASDKIPTEREGGPQHVTLNIVGLCKQLLSKTTLSEADIVGIGIGVPGMIDSQNGEVVFSNNFGWEHFYIAPEVEKHMGVPVKIANDANVAALGETKFGCGKKYKNTVMLTLGTGVGGGIVLDGKLYEGNRSAGAELGHSVIMRGGEQCSCGRRGCLETYASATAIIRDTVRAMNAHSDSKMWEIGSTNKVNGKTAFDYYEIDEYARLVVDNYIESLGVGIANIANVFRPEAVILGGGVCAQGDALITPLKKQLAREIYAGERGPSVDIVIAELENSAGLLGAAALLMD